MIITCLVCKIEGTYTDIGPNGWYLASNRPGGYTCSKTCDDVILAADAEAKAAKKKPKKE